MKNEFENKGQEGYNQSDKNKNLDPQAKQSPTPGKSVDTGTSGSYKKQQPGFDQGSQQSGKQQTGFSQYGQDGQKQDQRDIKNEGQSRSESIGYQAGVNTPGRDAQQSPEARQGNSSQGRERDVPARPEREGQDLEHLRNPDRTAAPERKEIDPVASQKRDQQQDRNTPSAENQQNPIV